VQVAQDLAVRRNMAGNLALRTLGPIAVMMPILMLVVWWVVSGSLEPVARVRSQVARARPTICRRCRKPACRTKCGRWCTN
jgi:hypothetical protein